MHDSTLHGLSNYRKETEREFTRKYTATLHLFTSKLGKHVGSFGDGPGEYKRLLDETGTLASYTAYDGSPFASENSQGRVSHLDFTIDAFGLPAFDWVLSLEVAEHIPAEFERFEQNDGEF